MKAMDGKTLRAARIGLLAMALGASGTGGAFAQTSTDGVRASAGSGSNRVVRVVKFDWHAKKYRPAVRAETVTPVAQTNYLLLGKGSYVCTPAGFGHRSTCFRR
ncbi:hypothetical protein [Ostreiculturibacter nitratireducens]|uniref:hypothetical protein n=1 Tax=Ostreiculturibacter nitratireducens TaxID=3075226 RepID=UPI0031B5C9DC